MSLRDQIEKLGSCVAENCFHANSRCSNKDYRRALSDVLAIVDKHDAKIVVSEMLVLSYAQRLAQTPHTGVQKQDAETYKVILRDMLTHPCANPMIKPDASDDRPYRAFLFKGGGRRIDLVQSDQRNFAAIVEAIDALMKVQAGASLENLAHLQAQNLLLEEILKRLVP